MEKNCIRHGKIQKEHFPTRMSINFKTKKPIYILGISCFYHDAAAVLLKDGNVVAAAEEERFSRVKHDSSFPLHAVRYCLKEASISEKELSYVCFYEKPIRKFERIIISFVREWPRGCFAFSRAVSDWLKKKLWVKHVIRTALNYEGPIFFSEHHLSHAASGFLVSPFEEAAILIVDGVGEWAVTSYGIGRENSVRLLKEIRYPHSLGLLYSAVTYFLGFKPNSDEYKVMGLAPYGAPIYVSRLKRIFRIYPDASFEVDESLYAHHFAPAALEKTFRNLLGFSKRISESPLLEAHKNLAASIQALLNETMVRLARHVREKTGMKNLCLAGGVALNCVANSEIFRNAGFDSIFIQPAAGDAGGALGAAYYVWHEVLGNARAFQMKHAFWGPSFSHEDIKLFLEQKGHSFETLADDELISRVAALLFQQNVVGWFAGRAEWGPRALGHRSILADPTKEENWKRVNMKIKFRESFRPLAPAVTEEDAEKYFDLPFKSPFMLFTARVKTSELRAVTHVDGTARVQTVSSEDNPRFHRLLKAFEKLSGHAVLINTSFNARGEPIVSTPEEAYDTFMKTDMDYLVLENYLIKKRR